MENVQSGPAQRHQNEYIYGQNICHHNGNPKFFVFQQRTNLFWMDKIEARAFPAGIMEEKQGAE